MIPKKSLGQNFLIDKNIVRKILNEADITNNNIIEIGPGLGALTEYIIEYNPKKLIVIEKDLNLYQKLLKKFDNKKIIILNEDALFFDYSKFMNFNIIANLPYNISSKFLLKIIKLNKNISKVVCMIQAELANKFDYNNGKMNKYKFTTEYCSNFEILFGVSPNVFYPKPKINSKVVKFKLKKKLINNDKLNYFTRNFFLNKRKKIKSNKIFQNIINEKIVNKRYEDLKYKDILEIYKRFNFFSS